MRRDSITIHNATSYATLPLNDIIFSTSEIDLTSSADH